MCASVCLKFGIKLAKTMVLKYKVVQVLATVINQGNRTSIIFNNSVLAN